jgi:hypothetical protein
MGIARRSGERPPGLETGQDIPVTEQGILADAVNPSIVLLLSCYLVLPFFNIHGQVITGASFL